MAHEDLVLPDGSTPRFEKGQRAYAFEEGIWGRVKAIKIERDHFVYTLKFEGMPGVSAFRDFEEFHLRDYRDGGPTMTIEALLESIPIDEGRRCSKCHRCPDHNHSLDVYICSFCGLRKIGESTCDRCTMPMGLYIAAEDFCILCEEGELEYAQVSQCPYCLDTVARVHLEDHLVRFHPGALE